MLIHYDTSCNLICIDDDLRSKNTLNLLFTKQRMAHQCLSCIFLLMLMVIPCGGNTCTKMFFTCYRKDWCEMKIYCCRCVLNAEEKPLYASSLNCLHVYTLFWYNRKSFVGIKCEKTWTAIFQGWNYLFDNVWYEISLSICLFFIYILSRTNNFVYLV